MGNRRTETKSKEPSPIAGLDNQQILRQLEDLAARLAVQIRYEKGDFHSAGCRVRDRNLIILQKTDSDGAKIGTLMSELGRFNITQQDIHPAIFDQMAKNRQDSFEHFADAKEEN